MATFTNVLESVDGMHSNIEQLNLTQNIVPMARSIVAALIALAILQGLLDSKSMVKKILYGAIAMSILGTVTTDNPIKNAVWETWRTVFTTAHNLGMKQVSKDASDSILGLTIELAMGTNKIAKVLIPQAIKGGLMIAAKTGMAVDVAAQRDAEFAQVASDLQKGASSLLEKSGLSVAAIIPFYATYLMITSTLGVAATAISIGYVMLLPALAAGRGNVLMAMLLGYLGLLFATAITPFIFALAIRIGYIVPINNANKIIAQQFAKFDEATSTFSLDPINKLISMLGSLANIGAYSIMAVLMVITCTAAAIYFLAKAPDVIMNSLKGR